jgi:hypothetical protein
MDIAGLPFWELTFDADGDQDTTSRDAFLAAVKDARITISSSSRTAGTPPRVRACALSRGSSDSLPGSWTRVPASRPVTVGLAGVIWRPSSGRTSHPRLSGYGSGSDPEGAASLANASTLRKRKLPLPWTADPGHAEACSQPR